MAQWLIFAFISAFFAALTTLLAKIGIEGIPSTLATAIRTIVVGVIAWSIVVATGEHHQLGSISRRSMIFLVLSGAATGASWLAYFRALQLAPASRVAPIDRLSLPLTIVMAGLFLGELISWRVGLGVTLMTIGALLTLG
jgi:transporter family protein